MGTCFVEGLSLLPLLLGSLKGFTGAASDKYTSDLEPPTRGLLFNVHLHPRSLPNLLLLINWRLSCSADYDWYNSKCDQITSTIQVNTSSSADRFSGFVCFFGSGRAATVFS